VSVQDWRRFAEVGGLEQFTDRTDRLRGIDRGSDQYPGTFPTDDDELFAQAAADQADTEAGRL
jgi:hypothetical protein